MFCVSYILGDTGAVSRVEGIFVGERLLQERESPWAITLTEPVPEAFVHENPFYPPNCPWVSEDVLVNEHAWYSIFEINSIHAFGEFQEKKILLDRLTLNAFRIDFSTQLWQLSEVLSMFIRRTD